MGSLKEYQSRMIYQFTQQELMAAELYKVLAHHFPEQGEFWKTLSQEELEHASWIEYLFGKIEQEEVAFEDNGVRTYTVETFLSYLAGVVAATRIQKPSLAKAVSLTLDIERAFLEKKLFDHFVPLTDEMRSVIRNLKEKMDDHIERTERAVAATPRAAVPA